jgi:hypothetical protein
MPYVKCPTCERVGHVAAARRMPELCRHCGDLLPPRRTVVPISLHHRLAADNGTAPMTVPAAATG